jgi:hypothetical protein
MIHIIADMAASLGGTLMVMAIAIPYITGFDAIVNRMERRFTKPTLDKAVAEIDKAFAVNHGEAED